MQAENLTDEQLWQAIAHNTEALSALIQQQLKTNRRPRRLQAILAYARTIDALERQYQIYVAELRRRYSLESEESARLDHLWKRCGNGNGRIGRVIASNP